MPAGLKTSQFNVVFELEDGSPMVFNSMTGAFAKIPPQSRIRAVELVNSPREFEMRSDEDHELVQTATRCGFIVKDETDEMAVLRLRTLVEKWGTHQFMLTILPTLRCNLACPYCYEISGGASMSKEKQHALTLWIKTMIKGCRGFNVEWFGGEPLMAYQVLASLTDNFVKMCDVQGVEYSAGITTNGVLLNSNVALQLETLRVRHCQVTLDGPEAIHDSRRRTKNGRGTFRTIISNLEKALELNPKLDLTLRVNYDETSYATVPELLVSIPDSIRRHSNIYFRQVFPPPQWWDESAPVKTTSVSCHAEYLDNLPLCQMAQDNGFTLYIMEHLFKAGYCQADFFNRFVVDPSCNLHKCTVAFDEKHRVGRILPDGTIDLDIPQLARWLARDIFGRPDCRACKLLPLCMAGCAFHSLCGDGNPVCNTVMTANNIVAQLRVLYRNLQLHRERTDSASIGVAPPQVFESVDNIDVKNENITGPSGTGVNND